MLSTEWLLIGVVAVLALGGLTAALLRRRTGCQGRPEIAAKARALADAKTFRFEPRKMTICVTNLTGYVPFCEEAGPAASAAAINDHRALMVPIIRRHGGAIGSFVGDGIVFFFGAPVASASHASDALEAVLEMQKAQEQFNRRQAERGLSALPMRVGVNSGDMLVGEMGTEDARSYSVLGEPVSHAIRLQRASKDLGVRNLVGRRTAEMTRNRFLVRMIGRVHGAQGDPIEAYEAMCRLSATSAMQQRLAQLSADLAGAFAAGAFERCLEILDEMDAAFGGSPLADVYRRAVLQQLDQPSAEFSGALCIASA